MFHHDQQKGPLKKKYIAILQPESRIVLSPKNKFSSPLSPVAARNTSSDILEQVISARQVKNVQSILTSEGYSPSIPFYSGDTSLAASPIAGSRKNSMANIKLMTKEVNDLAHVRSEGSQLYTLPEIPGLSRQLSNADKSRVSDREGRSVLLFKGMSHEMRNRGSFDGRSELVIKDVYPSAKGITAELKSVLSQGFDSNLETSINNFQVQEFINVQAFRLSNVLKVLEKGLTDQSNKDAFVSQEIWKIVSIEMNKIKGKYEEFLHTFNQALMNKKKEDANTQLNIWQGFGYLIEMSNFLGAKETLPSDLKAPRKKLLEDVQKNIYNFKLNLKTQQQAKKTNKKVLECYERIEEHLIYFNEIYQREKDKCKILLTENENLRQKYKEFEFKQESLKTEMVDLIDQKSNEYSNKVKQTLPGFQRRFFEQKIEDLEEEIQKLSVENRKLNETLKSYKDDKRFHTKDSSSKGTQDKGIMVNSYSEPVVKASRRSFSSFLKDSTLTHSGTKLSKPLTQAIISLMYSDKLTKDLCDDFERKPRKSLSSFAIEWFLRRFGLFAIAESFLKDFVFTLKSAKKPHDRNNVFLKLIGNEEVNRPKYKKGKKEQDSLLDYKLIKKAFYDSSEAFKQFSRIIDLIKTMNFNDPKSYFSSGEYDPFLPDLSGQQDLINSTIAINIIQTIAKEDKYSFEEINDIAEEFDILQEFDLYERVEGEKLIDIDAIDHEGEGSHTLSVDAFINFMLDKIMKRHISSFENVYTLLKANCGNTNEENITYEEFHAAFKKGDFEQSISWRDSAFSDMMNDPSADRIPLSNLVLSIIPNYLNENQTQDSKYRGILKKETTTSLKELDTSPGKSQITSSDFTKSPTIKQVVIKYEHPNLYEFKDSTLEGICYYHYDLTSSLTIIQEVYAMMENSIKTEEKYNEGLQAMHNRFLHELSNFNERFTQVKENSYSQPLQKRELVNFIEHLWSKLRYLLAHTFRNQKGTRKAM